MDKEIKLISKTANYNFDDDVYIDGEADFLHESLLRPKIEDFDHYIGLIKTMPKDFKERYYNSKNQEFQLTKLSDHRSMLGGPS